MRAAPSCTVELRQPQAERGLLLLLHAAAASVMAVWAALLAEAGSVVVASAGAMAALAGAGIGQRWGLAPLLPAASSPARLVLHWSGRAWHLMPSAQAEPTPSNVLARLALAIDAGPWLLLQVRAGAEGPRGSRWLVLRPGLVPSASWAALRVALAAQADRQAGPGPGAGIAA